MSYQVLITTSGLGQRLGDLTKWNNKSLVRVGFKPAISYIIEAYPEDVEFVITLGHYGSQVQQFLKLAYPEKHITYVTVDKYEGPGSSLAYSILQAKDVITGPFVFHACDTLVLDAIPTPISNWIGGFKGQHPLGSSANYVTFDTNSGQVTRLRDKGDLTYDYTYIGLAGIKDFEQFFTCLTEAYQADPTQGQLSDLAALRGLLDSKVSLKVQEFKNWLDIGNADGLKHARENIPDKFEILDKLGESIFIFPEKFVIKFFYDTEICRNRIERTKLLSGLIPPLLDYSENFYKYQYAVGQLVAHQTQETTFAQLLHWIDEFLWVEENDQGFEEQCYDFYYQKSLARINKFFTETKIKDEPGWVNDFYLPTMSELINQIDLKWLCQGLPSRFHGDLILDNILQDSQGNFVLLDWRQDFGGNLQRGDRYYDLAKLNHNLVFNHDLVNQNLFEILVGDKIYCNILQSYNLIKCQEVLHNFIQIKGWDLKKVKVLTSLIWINMAPLHHYPLNMFLFYFGKLNLFRSLA